MDKLLVSYLNLVNAYNPNNASSFIYLFIPPLLRFLNHSFDDGSNAFASSSASSENAVDRVRISPSEFFRIGVKGIA